MPYSVRTATPTKSEAGAANAILQASLGWKYKSFRGFRLALAYDANQSPVGVVVYSVFNEGAGEIKVDTVAVHPHFRRKGIASLLVKHVEGIAGKVYTAPYDLGVEFWAAMRYSEDATYPAFHSKTIT